MTNYMIGTTPVQIQQSTGAGWSMQNTGSHTVFILDNSNVSESTGYPVQPGVSLPLTSNVTLWAVCSPNLPSTISTAIGVQAASATIVEINSPVTVSGTVDIGNATVPVSGSVNIANTPNVGILANQSVNIGNTPSVSVANSPTVAIATGQSVNIGNTPNVNITNATIPVSGSVNIGNSPTVAIASNQSVNIGTIPAVSFAAGQKVDINNTPNVAITGTPSVNISNATVPVSGSVNIGNSPTVAIAANQNVNIGTIPAISIAPSQSVNIGNTPAVTIASGTVNANVSGPVSISSGNVTVAGNVGINPNKALIYDSGVIASPTTTWNSPGTLSCTKYQTIILSSSRTTAPGAVYNPLTMDTNVLVNWYDVNGNILYQENLTLPAYGEGLVSLMVKGVSFDAIYTSVNQAFFPMAGLRFKAVGLDNYQQEFYYSNPAKNYTSNYGSLVLDLDNSGTSVVVSASVGTNLSGDPIPLPSYSGMATCSFMRVIQSTAGAMSLTVSVGNDAGRAIVLVINTNTTGVFYLGGGTLNMIPQSFMLNKSPLMFVSSASGGASGSFALHYSMKGLTQ